MMKDSCWGDYNVTVNVIDTANGKTIGTVIVPTSSFWAREKFECAPGQTLQFQATFNPVFWEKDVGKTYSGMSSWALPNAVTGRDIAWNINMCFPKQFGAVPFPPEGTNKCDCSTKGIPPITP